MGMLGRWNEIDVRTHQCVYISQPVELSWHIFPLVRRWFLRAAKLYI